MRRNLFCGLTVGLALSAGRVPLGHELFSMPAVDAQLGYGLRAAVLAVLALTTCFAGELSASKRYGAVQVLLGATLGFAVQARLQLQAGGTGLLGPLVAATIFTWMSRGPQTPEAGSWLARIGLATGGAGVAIAFEGVARHGRLLSAGAVLDDSLVAIVLLASTLLGALIFGPTLKSQTARRVAVPVSIAMAALLACLSLRSIGQLSNARGWDRFIRQYGLLSYHLGQGLYDLLLGGVLFTLPALALGTALSCARRLDWSALLLGGAVGLGLIPTLIGHSQVLPPIAGEVATSSAGLISLGASVAGSGALLACFMASELPRIARLIGASLGLVVLVASFFIPKSAVPILAPWERVPIRPSLVIETPGGLLTVEPTGSGIERVTLDRRELTPSNKHAPRDLRHLETTFELLPKALRKRGKLRVLLVGQLTPGRAIGLSRQSIATLDRTGAWHASMPALESHLFRSSGQLLPGGDILTPAEAKARHRNGAYDLIWIPLVDGKSPIVKFDKPQPQCTTVAWFGVGRGATQRSLPKRGLLVSDYPAQLSLALVQGPANLGGPQLGAFKELELGGSLQPYSLLQDLSLHSYQRSTNDSAQFTERLRLANQGGEFETFTRALSHFHSIQEGSSPWATEAEATELDEETLEPLAQLTGMPGHAAKRWIEDLSLVLIGKRRIDWITRFIGPLAERFGPWPELELVLAESDLEGLLFERVLTRIDAIKSPEPQAAFLRAKALVGLGRAREGLQGLAAAYAADAQAAELLRGLLVEILLAEYGENALEALSELGNELDRDSRLIEAVQDRDGHGHDHEH